MNEWPKITDPAHFLHESGLLYRINREILHPLGMALSIQLPDYADPPTETITTQLCAFDDDEEGIIFDDEVMMKAQARETKFMTEVGQQKLDARQNKLGFVIQPLPIKTT